MYTARVPGHGLVDWSPERVWAHAAEIRTVHVERRRTIFRVPVPVARRTCVACGEQWPCLSAVWATPYVERST